MSRCLFEPATRMSLYSDYTYFFVIFPHQNETITLSVFSSLSSRVDEVPHFPIILSFRFLTSLFLPYVGGLFPFSRVLTEAHETATRIGGNKTVYRRAVQPLAAGIPKIPSEIADGISLQ